MNRLPNPSRGAVTIATAVLALSLAACSSTRPPSGGGAPAGSASRSGGYYLDDGPGADPPKNLDAIPDAVPRAEPLNPRTARPYVVFDRQYVPMTSLAPYRERGVATWYGRRYHGQKTSSGEFYDMYGMTAAHPTLPIPSYVRVTHLGNGRSVVVRVNDRGPFLNGRLIDLSYTAAAKLGYVAAGSAEVEVELITQFDQRGEAMRAQAPAPAVAGAQLVSATPASTSGLPAARGAGAGGATPAAAATAGTTVASGTASLGAAPEKLEMETVLAPAAPGASGAPPGPSPAAGAATGDVRSAETPQMSPASQAPLATQAPPTTQAVYLQLGAFTSREAAESSRARIARELEGVVGGVEVRREGALFKVHAGPYPARADALAAAERIRQLTPIRPFAVSR